MLKTTLYKLFPSKNEANVYLALLEVGVGTVSDISKKSKVKRTSIYDILRRLEEGGYIEKSKRNKKIYYSASDPRMLLGKLSEQQMLIGGIMPELMAIANSLPKKPAIRYYEGEEGIKNVYEDTLFYEGQEICMWGTKESVEVFDATYQYERYMPERIARKIHLRAIGPHISLTQELKSKDKAELRETRLIPREFGEFEVEINLYGKHKIGIMSFKEEFGIIIESEKIYRTLKIFFEFMWMGLAS